MIKGDSCHAWGSQEFSWQSGMSDLLLIMYSWLFFRVHVLDHKCTAARLPPFPIKHAPSTCPYVFISCQNMHLECFSTFSLIFFFQFHHIKKQLAVFSILSFLNY